MHKKTAFEYRFIDVQTLSFFCVRVGELSVFVFPSSRPDFPFSFFQNGFFVFRIIDALSIEARANDLLLGCKQEALLYMESAQMKDLSWSDTRSFSLTVRYKFNAAKSKYKGTGAGQDTINRM